MGPIQTLLIVTAIAGVAGTGLGGLVGAMFRKDSNSTVSLLLSFAGGVMLSVVCFDLIPEAIATNAGLSAVILSVLLGVAVIYILNAMIDQDANAKVPHIDEAHPKTADQLNELIHSNYLEEHQKDAGSHLSLVIAGVVMAAAIALHNVPEGMTIGASYASHANSSISSAMLLAVLIGLHNIPEGMAVSVPLISGGMGRIKAVTVTALSGVPTIFGALLGYWLGDVGPLGLTISLGFASGAMLYVVFGEIIPEAILLYRSKLPTFFVIIGCMLGLLIIYI